MSSHNHVNHDPKKPTARCGGPALCFDCAREQAQDIVEKLAAAKATGRPDSDGNVWVKLTPSQVRSIRYEVACHAPAWLYKPLLAQIPTDVYPEKVP